MSKNTCQQDAEIALKKAVQQDEWILLIGGTRKERERLSRVAYKSKECVKSVSAFSMYYHKLSRTTELLSHDYDRTFRYTKFKRHKFELLDVAGCSSEEMSRKILGPEPEKEYKSPNALLRNKPILNVLIQERLLFIDNLRCKNKDDVDVAKKISAQLRMYKSEYQGHKLGQLIVGLESKKDCKILPRMFLKLFKSIYLETEKDYEEGKQKKKTAHKKKVNKIGLKVEQQEVMSVETILFYNKTTGKFRFGNLESIAVSATSIAKARDMAGKLMKWWRKRKPCPLSEFGIDPSKKTPTHVYDNISNIRKVLEGIKVNMLQCTEGLYFPPSEPKHFNIEK